MPRPSETSETETEPSRIAKAAAFLLASAIVLVPAVVLRGAEDSFRMPKELLFRAEAILLLVVAVFALTSRQREPGSALAAFRRDWPAFALAGLTLLWTVITTLTSTNQRLSVDSLLTVIASITIFVAMTLVARGYDYVAIDLMMVGAMANTIIVTCQEFHIWQPFQFPRYAAEISSSGLIGNPNDVGSYLLVPAIIAPVTAIAARGPRRWTYLVFSLALLIGLVASGTRTALLAYVVALTIFAATRSPKAAIAVAVMLAILTFVATNRSTPLGRRTYRLVEAAAQRRFDLVFSERLQAFLAAIEMIHDHPLLGVGPGCFRFQYMDYRLRVLQKYPAEWTQGSSGNFAQTHNDHLQVMSETGVPGYALFAGVLVMIALPAFRRRNLDVSDPRKRIIHATRIPFVAGVFVLCMAQFPLELAACRLVLLQMAALYTAWSETQ